MTEPFWSALLFGLTMSVLGLALLPALHEWLRPRDAAPLLVVRRQDRNVRHFAESFRARVQPLLAQYAAQAHDAGRVDVVWHEREPVRIVADGADCAISEQEMAAALVSGTLMYLVDADLPEDIFYEREIYAAGRLRCGARSILRAAYAAGPVELGPGSTVARWLHTEARLTTAPGCRLLGRASAGERIVLAPRTVFERLNAPVIRCEAVAAAPVTAPGFGRQTWRPPPSTVAIAPDTYLIDGPLRLGTPVHLERHLIVRGPLTVPTGSVIDGSIKAYGDIDLATGVVVRGGIVSHRNITVGRGCRVRGPIVSERTVHLRRGCLVGTPRLQTTITAEDIVLEPGLQVSGTVWAHRRGVVSGGSGRRSRRSGKDS